MVELPVFVSVNVCDGSNPQRTLCARVVPGQLRVWVGLHVGGVNVAVVVRLGGAVVGLPRDMPRRGALSDARYQYGEARQPRQVVAELRGKLGLRQTMTA